jgi:predicted secreted protein
MTSAISAYGAKVNWNSNDIAEVISISGPGESVDSLDVTSHDSANEFREFLAGLRDGGEVSFEANFVSSDTDGQIALHTDFQAGTSRTCQVTLPDSLGNISGTAICTAYEFSFPVDGPARISCTIKYTGKPTLTIS